VRGTVSYAQLYAGIKQTRPMNFPNLQSTTLCQAGGPCVSFPTSVDNLRSAFYSPSMHCTTVTSSHIPEAPSLNTCRRRIRTINSVLHSDIDTAHMTS